MNTNETKQRLDKYRAGRDVLLRSLYHYELTHSPVSLPAGRLREIIGFLKRTGETLKGRHEAR